MLRKIPLLLIYTFISINCKQTVTKTNVDEGILELGTIHGYPNDFKGCGCAYSLTIEAYKKNEFLFLEKYGMTDESKNFKMISLDGSPIRWNATNPPQDFTLSISFDGSGKDREQKQGFEEKRGILNVQYKNEKTIKVPFIGYCGC